MTTQQKTAANNGLFLYVISILITIIGFFAAGFYIDVQEMKRDVNANSQNIEIIMRHEGLTPYKK